jgi:hypothetical protein
MASFCLQEGWQHAKKIGMYCRELRADVDQHKDFENVHKLLDGAAAFYIRRGWLRRNFDYAVEHVQQHGRLTFVDHTGHAKDGHQVLPVKNPELIHDRDKCLRRRGIGEFFTCIDDRDGLAKALQPVAIAGKYFDEDMTLTPDGLFVPAYMQLALIAYEAKADGVAILMPPAVAGGYAAHIVMRVARYAGNKMHVLYKGPKEGLDTALECFSRNHVLEINNGKQA